MLQQRLDAPILVLDVDAPEGGEGTAAKVGDVFLSERLLLGALGLAGMWAAIFADVGVMVLAVLNAVRALNVKNL